MQPGDRFRIKLRILGLRREWNQETANETEIVIRIPAGAEVRVLNFIEGESYESTRQVNVEFDGGTVQMFAADLDQRAERIYPAASK